MSSFIRTCALSLALASVITLAGFSDDKPQPANNDNPKPAAKKESTPAADKTADAEAKPARKTLPTTLQAAPGAFAPRATTDTSATPAEPLADSTLTVEPRRLLMGTVSTGKFARGTVKITNTGPEPIKLVQCKTSCGCTSTKCPKGQTLAPGQTEDVEIQITAGTRARKITKTVTFLVEGQQPVKLPVSVEVIAYVTIEPTTLDPDVNTDGKLVLTATDDQPFRIVSVNPPVIEDLDDVEAVKHELHVSWDKWRELGGNRTMTINIDHPETEKITELFRTMPKRARNTVKPGPQPQAGAPQARNAVAKPARVPTQAQMLAVAVKYGRSDEVSKALAEGIDQASLDRLLSFAARYGQVEIMDILITNGANLESTDNLGRTAVLSAVQARELPTVGVLLAKGADVNARDHRQDTALHYAAGVFGNREMVAALIAAGADVNAADTNGQTPLMWAARWGDAKRVQALIKAGAKPDLRDGKGLSALDYARDRQDRDDAQKNEVIAVIQPLTH